MTQRTYTPIGGLRNVADFKTHVASLGLSIPRDSEIESGSESPLAQRIAFAGKEIGNRFCIHPMEGWMAPLMADRRRHHQTLETLQPAAS
jgi:hypothetical protein